ncbi:MAG: glycosyltransferase family 4 protein [Paludibacter sp.]|nr:glycosyltransferase family 4 protein [Paludibacter sp.]
MLSLLGPSREISVLCPHGPKLKLHERYHDIDIFRFPYFLPTNYQYLSKEGGLAYSFKSHVLAKVQAPLFIVSELFHAAWLVSSRNVEIVNSHWLLPQGFVGALLRKFFDFKHVITLHSSEITFAKRIPFGRVITMFTINNADVIVSVSRHRANELLEMIPSKNRFDVQKKIKIIPMGVDVSDLMDENEIKNLRARHNIEQKNVILFVGRLVEVKGCKYLIQAMNLITRSFDDVILLIVGNGPLENELRSLVKEYQLDNYIRFEGFVNPEQIHEYYSIADLLVFPSIVDSSGFDEGLPVVLLEALAFGKPIVSTKVKGALEVIKDGQNGVFVEEKSPEQIAEKIKELLYAEHLRENLAKQARISAMKYDWKVIAQQYVDIYEGLM